MEAEIASGDGAAKDNKVLQGFVAKIHVAQQGGIDHVAARAVDVVGLGIGADVYPVGALELALHDHGVVAVHSGRDGGHGDAAASAQSTPKQLVSPMQSGPLLVASGPGTLPRDRAVVLQGQIKGVNRINMGADGAPDDFCTAVACLTPPWVPHERLW